MSWMAIITAILQMFGPIIVEWFKKWLDSKFQTAAANMPPPETFGTPEDAQAALFDRVLANTSRFAVLRRAMLRKMKATAAKGTLSQEDVAEVSELMEGINNE